MKKILVLKHRVILCMAFMFFLCSNLYGQQWEPMGSGALDSGMTRNTNVLVAPDGTTYVSYLYRTDLSNPFSDDKVSIKKFNGTSWETISNGISESATQVILQVDYDGTLYAACTTTNGLIILKKFNGTSWEAYGPAAGYVGLNNGISFVITQYGDFYISYSDADNGYKTTVKRFSVNTDNWLTVGDTELSSGGSSNTQLAVNADGILYLSYYDHDINKFTVKKFSETYWETVGTAGISTSYSINGIIKIAPDGTPYFCYVDINTTSRVSVLKFNGTTWETVGGVFVSESYSYFTSLAIAPNGMPYVAYSSGDHGDAATIKRFNGTSWVTLGTGPYLETQDAREVSLAISADGNDLILGHGLGPLYVYSYDLSAPPVGPTQLTSSFCGSTQGFHTPIYAENVSGATQYQFHVSIGGNVINTPVKPSRHFTISDINGFGYGKTYQVKVRARVNNMWSDYGDVCNISSPPVPNAKLTNEYCGATVSFNMRICADVISYAAGYRFRVTDGANVQVIENSSAYFFINQFAGYGYGKTYTVDVSAKVDGQWKAYGPPCNISTISLPVTQLRPVYCGITVSFATNIYANAVHLATGYRFRVTEGANVQYIEKPSPYFTVNEISGYAYNKTYTIAVAAGINGQWADYSSTCTISTVANPTSQLDAQYCGATVTLVKGPVYANNVSQASLYRFRITDGANTYVLERTQRVFLLRDVPGIGYGKTYSIEVAVLHSGSWGPYSATCTVSTPSAMLNRQGDVSSEDVFEAGEEVTEIIQPQAITLTSYPNPYSDAFTIDMSTHSAEKVTVRAFDMNGRLVEDITVSPEELSSQKLGNRYAAGIYNVIVTQGDYQKAFKVVKR